jgi:membrane-associated phospholipid phosphatase
MRLPRLRFATLGMTTAVLFAALGVVVGRFPDPAWMMPFERSLVGHGALIAWWITWCGWIDVLLPLAIVLLIVAWRFRAWRSRLIFVVVEMALAWRTTDCLQKFFARPRRLDWVVKHESSFSYPSSHAAVASVVYLLLAVLIARSSLRGRVWIAGALALLALGILWSRLALGAHYLTDLAGGLLWGIAVVAGLAACWPTNVFEGRSAASLE